MKSGLTAHTKLSSAACVSFIGTSNLPKLGPDLLQQFQRSIEIACG